MESDIGEWLKNVYIKLFRSFNSIKGELIPYLIKKQYRRNKKCVGQQDVQSSKEVLEEDKNGKIKILRIGMIFMHVFSTFVYRRNCWKTQFILLLDFINVKLSPT